MEQRKIILGVTESDAHSVANQIIEYLLVGHGYTVINLGSCTKIEDFAKCYHNNQDSIAIAIGSQNGHALEDLKGLKKLKIKYNIACPIIVGGSLSIGIITEDLEKFYSIGIDYILKTPEELIELLGNLNMISYNQDNLKTG